MRWKGVSESVESRLEEGFAVFYCSICGLGYSESETASQCETYCSSHDACSLVIARKAIRKPNL
jgi:hypothetical protein